MSPSIESMLTHRDWVRRVARALVHSDAEAEEIEQEAWVRAVTRPPSSEGKCKAWFRTVLKRAARDRWRARTRRDAREVRSARPPESAPTADLVAEAESHRLVVNAALALPEPYRETIVLRFFHELPAAEIAERLDVPLETVRTGVKRALGRLRKELDDRHGGDRRAWTAMVALLIPASAKAGTAIGVKAGLVAAAASLLVATVALWPKAEETLPPTTIGKVPAVAPADEFETLVEPEIEPDAPPPVEPAPAEDLDGPSLAAPPPPPPEPALIVTVIDHRARPLAGATVRIHPKKSREVTMREYAEARWAHPAPGPLPALIKGRTDSHGRLVIADLPDRAMVVCASARGFVHRTDHRRLPGVRSVTLALRPAVELSGTVRLRNGTPVPGATVTASTRFDGSELQATAVTGRDGSYRLSAVPRGRAILAVRLDHGLIVSTSLVDTRRLREFPIVLDLAAAVRGRVVDDRTGRGVAGVEVAVGGSRGRHSGGWTTAAVVTKADGTWSFPEFPVGQLGRVRARADGYLPVERIFNPAWDVRRRGETVLRDIRLARGAVVSGEVRYETGEPAPGARVWLLFCGLPDDPVVIADRRGRYRFAAVPAGVARVYVSGPDCWQRGNDVGYRPEMLPDELRVVVPVSGEVRKTVSVVRGAVVTGVVQDPDGTPRPGVEAYSRPGGRVGAPTDEFGRFRLANVPTETDVTIGARRMGGGLGHSGSFRLRTGETRSDVVVVAEPRMVIAGRVRMAGATLPDGIDLRIASRGGGDRELGWESGCVVPVTADGTFRAEWFWSGRRALFATADGCGETVVALPEMAISGRVVREDGKSTAGAPIFVLSRPKDEGTSAWGAIRGFAGETGRFTVKGLVAGRYRVTADLPGMIGASRIVAAGTKGLLLTARPARRITGILMDADTKKPVPNVTITAQASTRTKHQPDQDLCARSGPDGRFVLESLNDLPYRLWIAQAAHSRPEDPEYVLEKREFRAGDRNLRIWLVPGRTIEGRVLGGNRRPLGGVRVSSNRGDRGVTTGHDGTFRLARLRPGKHELRFTDMNDRGMIRVIRKGVPAGTRDVLVTMEAGPSISGRLLDPEGNVPAGRGRLAVTLPGARRGPGVRVAADGTFRTPPLRAGRTYDLRASGYDDTIGVRVKGIRPGATGVRVVLRRGGTISGRVLDENGDPVPAGLFVAGYGSGTKVGHDPQGDHSVTRTKEDGTFVLRGVGDFIFRVRAAGSGSNGFLRVGTKEEENVRPGATGLVLRVCRGVRFSGRLVDRQGRGVACKLEFWQLKGSSGRSGSCRNTTAEGRFSYGGVRPGRVRLVAIVSGVKIDLGEFTAPAEEVVITVNRLSD